jgi:hypothetical protein
MPLTNDVREALAELKSASKDLAANHPDLEHFLVETPDLEAFQEAERAVSDAFMKPHTVIRSFSKGQSAIHVFVARDWHRGGQALESLYTLAGDVVSILAGHECLEPPEHPVDPSGHPLLEGRYHVKRLMAFVHRFADAHSDTLIRSVPSHRLGYNRLEKGGLVRELRPRLFQSLSRVFGRILNETMERTPNPAVTPSGAKGTPGKRRRGRVLKKLTDKEQEVWQLYQKHRGEADCLYEVGRIVGLGHDQVERIVRMIRAREGRAS